jgi:KaiC/GvpD/RAD55 family RecA-like ATPase
VLDAHTAHLYDLLGHEGHWSQLQCYDTKTKEILNRRLVHGKEAVIDWAKTWNKKGNCFIGRAPRSESGTPIMLTCFSLDIDPVRETEGATDEQHQTAIRCARKVKEHLGEGVIASSGNGALLLFPFPSALSMADKALYEANGKSIEEEARKVLAKFPGVKVDATHDAARLVKLLGTQSTKGELRERRISKFLQVFGKGRTIAPKVFERIRKASGSKPRVEVSSGIRKGSVPDRSQTDFALVCALYNTGASDEFILNYMKEHGARPERSDDHVRLLEKAKAGKPVSVQGELPDDCGSIEAESLFSTETGIKAYKERKERAASHSEASLPTGIQRIDDYTGGLKRKDLWVFGARTGIGKTSLAINIAQNLIGRGKRVLFLSTEMAFEDVLDRFVSLESDIATFNLTTGRLDGETKERLERALQSLQRKPLFICDRPEPSKEDVEKLIKRVTPDVVMFDHIQRVDSKTDKAHSDITKFLKGFKNLCSIYDCAGVVTSQLNRGAENVNRPSKHHLAESGTIEQEAAVIILLTPLGDITDRNLQSIPMLASLVKNRYGRCVDVELQFETSLTKFKGV